jgi:hypothetical protein
LAPGAAGGRPSFSPLPSTSNFDDANIELVVLATGERKVLHRGAPTPVTWRAVIWCTRERRRCSRPPSIWAGSSSPGPRTILEGIASNPFHGSAQFDVSANGLLVYLGGGQQLYRYSMVWVDRDGEATPLSEEQKTYGEPHFSPDGSKLAVQVYEAGRTNSDVWVYDLKRGVPTRLTFDESDEAAPFFSPDGQRVVSARTRAEPRTSTEAGRRIGRDGEADREPDHPVGVFHLTDGKHIVFHQSNSGTASDLFVPPLRRPQAGDFPPDPVHRGGSGVLARRAMDRLSVQRIGGGRDLRPPLPVWFGEVADLDQRRQVRLLALRRPRALLLATTTVSRSSPSTVGRILVADKPRQLFDGPFLSLSIYGSTLADYDVSPDGKRFVMMQGEEQLRNTKVTVVFNWFEVLKKTFSAGGS